VLALVLSVVFMVLASGSRLGPYEVVAPVGAGGMGEVYRARDTRLDRTVAIKVLPARFADDPQFRERFEREARAISQLSHPHICVIHDIAHADGTDFLVMEYLEGETLAARLLKGALPLNQVMDYAIQIADALDNAHRHGIVHRDLKPANIMITRSGAKLLDFGLAKLRPEPAVASAVSATPTITTPLTGQGSILGTLQYMAPEQLEGKAADTRADLFAFGAIVHEMATGKKAFDGKSQASVIAAILDRDPPPMSASQPLTPPQLDHVVSRCLAKDPDERWQSASDVVRELRWIAQTGSSPVDAARRATTRRSHLMWIAPAALSVLLLALATQYRSSGSPTAGLVVRFAVPPPEGATWDPLSSMSLSPDGRYLAFTATSSAARQLWIRSLDSLDAKPIPGTELARLPFWSPDSRHVGFFAVGKLKRIARAGGAPQTICDMNPAEGQAAISGATWNRDDIVLFGQAGSISRVPAAGGSVESVRKRTTQEAFGYPWFLPDGRRFLYLTRGTSTEISVGSLDSSDAQRLGPTDSNAAFVAPGYLVFTRDRHLLAQRFDADHLRPMGDPIFVGDDVVTNRLIQLAAFSASDAGALAYRSGLPLARPSRLVWVDRVGRELSVVGSPRVYQDPALSPDGTKIAFTDRDPQTGSTDIWLIDLARGVLSRLTFNPDTDAVPVWSPDGRRIAFASNRGATRDLYQSPTDGSGSDEPLLVIDGPQTPDDWSQDGKFLLFDTHPMDQSDIWMLPIGGDRKPVPVVVTPYKEGFAQFSPDGNWIAYQSNKSGRDEVYVRRFFGPSGDWPVSSDGGVQPKWRGDGKELFYLAPDRALMAVDLKLLGATPELSAPKRLFQTRVPSLEAGHYAVAPDGHRFLMDVPLEDAKPAPITIVLNWAAALQK
jgi:eukaryotic-like serine/threonine-protein kinase